MRDQYDQLRAVVVENTKAPTLKKFAKENCNAGATIVTNTHGGYIGLTAAGYDHIKINHSAGEYVRDMAHTNGIESFWALLKRGYKPWKPPLVRGSRRANPYPTEFREKLVAMARAGRSVKNLAHA